MTEPVLVYVDGPWAYFADGVEGVYGDDWDDAPYECNAGAPLERFVRLKVAFDGPLETPEMGSLPRSAFPHGISVDDINRLNVPWLADFLGDGKWNPVRIWAGTSVRKFVTLIEESGGHVWVPMDGVPWLERVPV